MVLICGFAGPRSRDTKVRHARHVPILGVPSSDVKTVG